MKVKIIPHNKSDAAKAELLERFIQYLIDSGERDYKTAMKDRKKLDAFIESIVSKVSGSGK